jgi:hypothetical protein
MVKTSGLIAAALWMAVVIPPPPAVAQAPADPSAEVSAKTWLGNHAEIETFIRTASVVGDESLPIGVTKPRRLRLEPGGPVDYVAFKSVPRGRVGGFMENYKSEIAAYELDKLLGLGMVPPTVEKRVKGVLGAAVMWCSPLRSFTDMGGIPDTASVPPRYRAAWVRQMVRAKMFDNLIGNKDPNEGNWLVDPSWNLIVIDKTRAFTTDRDLAHESMANVDEELWERMQTLTEESLTAAIGSWVGRSQIRAILERRKRMQQMFDALIAPRGEAGLMR